MEGCVEQIDEEIEFEALKDERFLLPQSEMRARFELNILLPPVWSLVSPVGWVF